MKQIIFALVAACLLSGAAHAYEIRFEDGHTADWQPISDGYGNVPGLADVSYYDLQRNELSLLYWTGAYSGHPAAFAGNDNTAIGYVMITPLPGYQVKLNSFFLGSYQNVDRATSYIVNDDATPWVDFSSGPIVVGAAGLLVTSGLTSADEIEIGFGPTAYNVGINYINFDVTPVPEPGNWILLLAGLGLLGITLRRKASLLAGV